MELGNKESGNTGRNIPSYRNLICLFSAAFIKKNRSSSNIRSRSSLDFGLACDTPLPISPGRGLYSEQKAAETLPHPLLCKGLVFPSTEKSGGGEIKFSFTEPKKLGKENSAYLNSCSRTAVRW